jgi:mRNA interferase HigB
MRIISRSRLQEFGKRYDQAVKPLAEWYSITSKAEWANYDDLRKIYASADQARVKSGGIVTVFNIGGNKFRLIVAIHYNTQTVYILSIMTHEKYTENTWKDRF